MPAASSFTGRDENPGSRALDTRERGSYCKTQTTKENATICYFVIQWINKRRASARHYSLSCDPVDQQMGNFCSNEMSCYLVSISGSISGRSFRYLVTILWMVPIDLDRFFGTTSLGKCGVRALMASRRVPVSLVLVKCDVSAARACVTQKIEDKLLENYILNGSRSPTPLSRPHGAAWAFADGNTE
jgi:hypothetical protein